MAARDSVTYYAVWCEDEQAYVNGWSAIEPVACPNSTTHAIDGGKTLALETLRREQIHVGNLPLTPFNRVMVGQETTIFDIKPGLGLSELRNIVETQGGATVTNAVGEPEISLCVHTAGDTACLKSAQRSRYVAGMVCEVGIGGHLKTPLQGDQSLRFGLFDDNDGFMFLIQGNELSVQVRKDGEIVHNTPRTAFSVDTVDGTGPSRHVINPFKGYIWNIMFSWYGYGVVEFQIIAEDAFGEQRTIRLHRYYTQYRASISNPCLPITAELKGGTTEAMACAYITGRKFAILGPYNPTVRRYSKVVTWEAGASGTQQAQTLLCIRRKIGRYVSVNLTKVTATVFGAAVPVGVHIVMNADVDAIVSAWTAPDGVVDTETVVEVGDMNASSPCSGGNTVWNGLAYPHPSAERAIDVDLVENQSIAFCAEACSAGTVVTLDLVWTEEW